MVMMRIVDIISTIPLTLYVILIMVLLGQGIQSIIIALGTVYWVDMARGSGAGVKPQGAGICPGGQNHRLIYENDFVLNI